MASPTAASAAAVAMLASLHQSRSATGDFAITCQGQEVRAHLLILSHGSDYFRNIAATDFVEKDQSAVDIKDCSPATVAATIDFLYGVELPEDFADLQGLLRLADMFFMEELREELGRRLAMGITAENYVERSMMAETYRSPDLATACAKYIVNQGEGIDWGAIKEMPRVTAAVAETATQVLRDARKSNVALIEFKECSDFESSQEYSNYVKVHAKEGARVKSCEAGLFGVKMGELGVVVRNTGGHLEMLWDKGIKTCISYSYVRIMATLDKDMLLAK